MAALGTFAGACTLLESIVLSFDANIDVVLSPSLSDTTITHLNVVDSPIDESYVPGVPNRLATLFPSLTWSRTTTMTGAPGANHPHREP
ncbi:hypothetical protein GGF50DRAFT_113634 [Schizophyllum commune]